MVSPPQLYLTAEASLTLTCQVGSPEQVTLAWQWNWLNETQVHYANSTKLQYTDGKTVATLDYTTDMGKDNNTNNTNTNNTNSSSDNTREYRCGMSATEYSTENTTVQSFELLLQPLFNRTLAKLYDTVNLTCIAQSDPAILDPKITWWVLTLKFIIHFFKCKNL